MAIVRALSITPVKSTALVHPDRVRLERYGVAENRRFFLVNAEGRLLRSGRQGPLKRIRSWWEPERGHLSLEFPDGRRLEGVVEVSDRRLVVDFWGRPVAGFEVDGSWSETLTAYLGEPIRLLFAERPGAGVDSYAVSLVSRESVQELARRIGAPVDARRFRMLVEIEGVRPHGEDEWLGREVRLGEAVIQVIEPDPRCVVTTQDPDTGEANLDTLKAIAGYRPELAGSKIPFGVYARVVEPGAVAVGDPVEVLQQALTI